jgi:heat shock protein HslJ
VTTDPPHPRPRRRASVLRTAACLSGVFLLVAAGCGDDDTETGASNEGAGSGGSGGSGPPLEGTAWQLTADAPLGVALAGVGVTAQFEDGKLTGNSGCNQYNGTYEVDGDALTIGSDIASTQIACPAPQMAVERVYLTRLPKVASFEIDGDALTLSDEGGETLLTYEAIDAAAAIRSEWEVTGYYAGTAITSVLGGATLTAEFGDGTVSGNTGCNTFTGPYEIDGQNITIGPLTTTLAACATPELDQQQANYLNALALARTFEVTAGRLDLFRVGHTIAVNYVSG